MTPYERLELIAKCSLADTGYRRECEKLSARGWTDQEIVDLLRLTEEVSPHISEDTALRGMGRVHARVAARLKG